jgi:hypothetical protein
MRLRLERGTLFAGSNAAMAYLAPKKIAMVVTTTLGRKTSRSIQYSTRSWPRSATTSSRTSHYFAERSLVTPTAACHRW